MEESAGVESRLEAEQLQRQRRLDQLATVVALLLLSATFWLAWPDIESSFTGERSVLQSLGAPLIVLAWALVMQDLPRMNASARSRIGAAATVAWLPLALMGTWTLESETTEMIGGVILILVAGALYKVSRNMLTGLPVTVRYRGVMGAVGCVLAFSLVVASSTRAPEIYLSMTLIVGGVALSWMDWNGADEDRTLRKEFRRRLDRMEMRILELRSTGAAVDQAASLVMTAGEEGHLDLAYGMRLLEEAEDDIERTLRFTEDVEDIRAEVARVVEEAETIAPLAKRPSKSMIQGDRELELGSLREAEQLYRQAKIRAEEVVEWWAKAESAISEAKRILSQHSGAEVESMRSILKEAEGSLESEQPKKAFEFASVIPEQIANVGAAVENAGQSVSEAESAISDTDGMDISVWEERIKQAKQALDDGDHSLARGLSDGIVREIVREKEAMGDVQRAMRQRKKLVSRYSNRADAEEWDQRLEEIKSAADQKQWSHAATLLERMTKELDSQVAALDEANELLKFVQDEWRVLRNQLDASGVKVDDEQRRLAEATVSESNDAHSEGRVDDCLTKLGEADALMEKLRRRL